MGNHVLDKPLGHLEIIALPLEHDFVEELIETVVIYIILYTLRVFTIKLVVKGLWFVLIDPSLKRFPEGEGMGRSENKIFLN